MKYLGALIGRSADAVVRKVGNLASFDPKMKSRGVGGLAHTAKLDEVVWKKYYGNWEKLAYDAELILASLRNKGLEESLSIDLHDLPVGEERIQEIKRRINQDFFRETVLENLLGISRDYEKWISDTFSGERPGGVPEETREYILGFNHKKIVLPRRFLPNRDLLAQHYEHFCHDVV